MPTTTTNKNQSYQTNNLTNTQEQEAIKTPPSYSTSSSPPSQESEKPQQKSPQTASPDTQSIASITSIKRPTPPTSPMQQQTAFKATSPSLAQQVERDTATPPTVASSPKPAATSQHITHQIQTEAPQKQQSPKPEFRSVAAASPQAAAVNVYTRQTDSPRSVENATPPRVSESPFRLAQQQPQRTPVAVSPLAQQQMTPSSASSGATISPNPPQAQTVPWRTQRGQTPQQQAPPTAQSHPQPFYNNTQQQQQQQRTPDFSTQTSAYQGPKPVRISGRGVVPSL